MSYPGPFAAALWIWLAIATVVAGGLVALHIFLLNENDDEFGLHAAVLAFVVASTGFLFCPLMILGYPRVALWTWRILAAAAVVLGLGNLARLSGRRRLRAKISDWLSNIAATAFAVGILVLAVLSGLPPRPSVSVAAGSPLHIGESLSRLDFWQTASLVILACGTLLFALLFISAMQRHGLLWFESHSGGLGGGVGGWRMSSSMAYLIATVLFGVLFGTVLAHEDGLKSRGTGGTSAGEPHVEATKGTATSNPKPKTESEGTPAPASAGTPH